MIEAVVAGLKGDLGVMYQIITCLAVISVPASIYLLIDSLRTRAKVIAMLKDHKQDG